MTVAHRRLTVARHPLRAMPAGAAGGIVLVMSRPSVARLEQAAGASPYLGPVVLAARRAVRHEVLDRGAALTYYSTLSLIPGLLVLFSLLGLLGDQGTVEQVLDVIDKVGPPAGEGVARQPLESLLRHDAESGGLLGAGLLAVLWTASAYVGCFFRASARVWEVEQPKAWRAWPLRLGLTVLVLVLLALALLLLVLTGRLASAVGDAVGLGTAALELYGVLKWPALLLIVVALVGLLYRVSPTAARPRPWWQLLTPGGAIAVVVWTVGSAGFEIYVDKFASYDTVYGTLGTTIAALVWLWLTNLVFLAGVELDAALELSRAARAPSPES